MSCITDAGFYVRGGFDPRPGLNVATVSQGLPVRLYADPKRFLIATLWYRHFEAASGVWLASLAGYAYDALDESEREIVVYHWHPGGSSRAKAPHVHVGACDRPGGDALAKAHLPTGGPVPISAFVRLLIEDLEVAPNRDDWREVLDRCDVLLNEARSEGEG